MKIVKYINILIIGFGILNSYGASEGFLNKSHNRQTKLYSDKVLDAKSYYEAALKGELITSSKKIPLLFSEMKKIGIREYNKDGGIYKDSNGDIWFVKTGENPLYEYLGSKIMNLLIGPYCPEVELLRDQPNLTASKLLSGFLTREKVQEDSEHTKPIVGELELAMAMNIMGLKDRHDRNQGYVDEEDKLQAARVDFDTSFDFYGTCNYRDLSLPETRLNNIIKISTDFAAIPDEQILYVLGDAYHDLWESGFLLDYELLKDLGNKLIERKNQNFELQIDDILMIAVSIENKEIVQSLIQMGANPNAKKSQALYEAVKAERMEIVELLLQQGSDITSKALNEAARKGKIEIVQLFLEQGAGVFDLDLSEALNEAFWSEQFEVMQVLFEHGGNSTEFMLVSIAEQIERTKYRLKLFETDFYEQRLQTLIKAAKLFIKYGPDKRECEIKNLEMI